MLEEARGVLLFDVTAPDNVQHANAAALAVSRGETALEKTLEDVQVNINGGGGGVWWRVFPGIVSTFVFCFFLEGGLTQSLYYVSTHCVMFRPIFLRPIVFLRPTVCFPQANQEIWSECCAKLGQAALALSDLKKAQLCGSLCASGLSSSSVREVLYMLVVLVVYLPVPIII